jgi:hypothetical protein
MLAAGSRPGPRREATVPVLARNRTLLAWLLFVATFGCLAAGLLVRPLTAGVLVQGAIEALVFRLSFAAIGLLLTRRGRILGVSCARRSWVGAQLGHGFGSAVDVAHSGRPAGR